MEQAQKSDQSIRNKIKACWKDIDKENICVITYPELRSLLKNMGVSLSEEEFKQVLQKVDKGDTGTIEYQDFEPIGYELV